MRTNTEIKSRYLWENLYDIQKTITYCMDDVRKDERKNYQEHVLDIIQKVEEFKDKRENGKKYGDYWNGRINAFNDVLALLLALKNEVSEPADLNERDVSET